MTLDFTHEPSLQSWVASANRPSNDFPIQNLPHGIFRRAGGKESFRGGVAIGDFVLDLSAVLEHSLFSSSVEQAARAASLPSLNQFMALGSNQRRALRAELVSLLQVGAPHQEILSANCLVHMNEIEYDLPARIENFSDFYSSLSHATNVGALFRPDNPILPNYRWLPVGYHGRTSSLRVSGFDVRRPMGQLKDPAQAQPEFLPCKRLDYEVELGFLIGQGNELGTRISIDQADDHIFGVCLLNDWSARDIQSWEYQPLGPFLSKSFLSSLSPWVVTMEALEPFRTGFSRPSGEPTPLPHLWSDSLAQRGSIDIRIHMSLQTARMRQDNEAPIMISSSRFTDAYWAMAQLVAHQTSNGTNLCPGDLLGSGTLSGPEAFSRACLLEMTVGGKEPLVLPNGEKRTFLEDGDTMIMTAHCERDGYARIGFGECRTTVLPAQTN